MNYRLSKSKILSGLQCEKRLFLEIHQPDLAVISDTDEYRFDFGYQVGEVAQNLFPGGKLIEYDPGLVKAIEETKELIANEFQSPIFEATFSFEDVLIRSDILIKEDKGYRAIEVKSATSVKDYYLNDCAVQKWVMEGAGCPVSKIELAHIDNTFVFQGNNDYSGLFYHADLTGEANSLKSAVPKWVSRFKSVLSGPEPLIEPGSQCYNPFSCPFINHCIKETVEYPVSILPRGGSVAEELKNEGIEDVRDIPEGRLTNPTHEKVRRVTISGKPEIDPEIGQYLKSLHYPRYYLDFETIQFAVPIWIGTRPYQQLPFQWSCHIEDSQGNISHEEFLDISGSSPFKAFIDSLVKALGDKGSIFVYSAFEKTRLSELATFFPERSRKIEKIKDRLVDLLPLVRNHYYHPEMYGSFSIKAVLPTVAPDLDYSNLDEVQDGGSAQAAFLEAINLETDLERKKDLEKKMLVYCGMDTMAMVKMMQFFT